MHARLTPQEHLTQPTLYPRISAADLAAYCVGDRRNSSGNLAAMRRDSSRVSRFVTDRRLGSSSKWKLGEVTFASENA